jgi:hypothetical protein
MYAGVGIVWLSKKENGENTRKKEEENLVIQVWLKQLEGNFSVQVIHTLDK